MTAKSKVRSWSPLVNCGLVMVSPFWMSASSLPCRIMFICAQRPGGVVLLLAVDRDAARRFGGGLEQQRARAAGRVVDGLVLAGVRADADDLGQDPGDLGRRVELALALAGLGGEVPHQVLVGVAEQVVALGAAAAEVEVVEDGDQLGEPVLHLLALAELLLVVEVGQVDDLLEIVGFGELADDLVDLVADLLVALEREHVVERAALGHVDQAVRVSLGLVRDVLHEQQREDVVLVLRGVHAAAQLVAALPERAVQVRLLQHVASHPVRHRRAHREAPLG